MKCQNAASAITLTVQTDSNAKNGAGLNTDGLGIGEWRICLMIKRKYLKKEERLEIYNKTGGCCAYCGCELEYKDMQVDYVVPLNGWSEKGSDTIDNMLPACRSCNHYKSRSTLEGFRKMVESMPDVLMRDSVTYRNAVRFGLVNPNPHPVKFYFEWLNENEKE